LKTVKEIPRETDQRGTGLLVRAWKLRTKTLLKLESK
jgi:hypothetical protein